MTVGVVRGTVEYDASGRGGRPKSKEILNGAGRFVATGRSGGDGGGVLWRVRGCGTAGSDASGADASSGPAGKARSAEVQHGFADPAPRPGEDRQDRGFRGGDGLHPRGVWQSDQA